MNSGLQAEERVRYELDVRQQGSFQHEVLARFHEELRRQNKKWRDISPAQARARIGEIADQLMPEFQQGMLLATEQNRFVARSFKESLQVFIEAMIGWMKQYEFDPEVVEIGFGMKDGSLPAWELDLQNGHALLFRGRIDRVDLWRVPGRDEAICVVMDYKSSLRKLDPLYLEHGLQQQLPAYLNMLRAVKNPQEVFQVSRIIPAGVFYINLRGKYEAGANRTEVLANKSEATRTAYMHEGLFDFTHLAKLDSRPGVVTGDQFNYRLRKDGQPDQRSAGVLKSADFTAMLDRAEGLLREMGGRIYQGDVKIDPFKRGQETACDKCEYQGVCRIDSWTHSFRRLTKVASGEDA